MYTNTNYRTKKALRLAVADGKRVTYYQPGPYSLFGGPNVPADGTIYLEGPHYPAAHTWYAQATVKGGAIVKVK
jgi:hypothetical protein